MSSPDSPQIKVFNTLTGQKEDLVPLKPKAVGVYVCGPTVYSYVHIGNARTFTSFDVIVRYLRYRGFQVTYVRNYTDVDDKIIQAAKESGEPPFSLAARFIEEFEKEAAALGMTPPDVAPRVSDHLPQIISMIARLIESGNAYASQGDVYFSVSRYPEYAKLSKRNIDDLRAGERVQPGEQKREPLDFALWKAAKPGEPAWDSPWGKGRPGWHIECSAMAAHYLGETLDIHGGGRDLIFPHHENEIAQSEALMERPPMAEFWVHGGLLNFDNRKMSKSLGNFEPLTELLKRHDAFSIRLLFLQTGYRKPMNFTEESIAGAKVALEKLVATYRRAETGELAAAPSRALSTPAGHREAAFAHLDDDMNTAGALGVVFDLAADLTRYDDLSMRDEGLALMREIFAVFGIEPALDRKHRVEFDQGFVERLRGRVAIRELHDDLARLNAESPEAAIEAVIARRNEARRDKDFALGDRLRDALAAEGVVLKDSKHGTSWTVAGA
jgi:cysteinyl-tRNA synthetase